MTRFPIDGTGRLASEREHPTAVLPASVVTDSSATPKDIDSTGVSSGQVLAYDVASGKFKPTAGAGANAVTTAAPPLAITGAAPTAGQVLQATDGTHATWGSGSSSVTWLGAWLIGTTYAQGAGVTRSGVMYVSNVAGNVGHDPATDAGVHWATFPGLSYNTAVYSQDPTPPAPSLTGNVAYLLDNVASHQGMVFVLGYNAFGWPPGAGGKPYFDASAGAAEVGTSAEVMFDHDYGSGGFNIYKAEGGLVSTWCADASLNFADGSSTAITDTQLYRAAAGKLVAGGGLGLFGATPPALPPATPVTLGDVIAILKDYGLCKLPYVQTVENGNAPNFPPAAGMNAYWRLNESSGTVAADQIAVYPGTYTGGFTLSQTGALTGSGDNDHAVALNGTTGWISLPSSDLLNLNNAAGTTNGNQFSLEAWVKPTDAAAAYVILSKGTGSAFQWWLDTDGVQHFRFNSVMTPLLSNTTLTLGAWNHVVVTWNPLGTPDFGESGDEYVQFYLNGALDSNRLVPTDHTQPTANAANGIGATTTPSRFFKGSIDEVAVYGYMLSASQVATHYNAGTVA